MPQFELHDTGDLKRLSKDLRQASNGKELRKEFTGKVRGVLGPVVTEVKVALVASPSQGHGTASRARRSQPGLRALLAKATRMEVRTTGRQAGIRIRVDGRRMPPGMKALPRYREGTKRRWRHPVFANPDVWVDQSALPTATPVVERHQSQVVAAVDQAADAVRRKIERGTI